MGRLEYVAARSRASTSCRMRSRRWPCRSGSAPAAAATERRWQPVRAALAEARSARGV